MWAPKTPGALLNIADMLSSTYKKRGFQKVLKNVFEEEQSRLFPQCIKFEAPSFLPENRIACDDVDKSFKVSVIDIS